MQQINRFVDSEYNNYEGLRKFNEMMRKHPDFRVVCMNTVPRGGNGILCYIVVDVPDKEEKEHE